MTKFSENDVKPAKIIVVDDEEIVLSLCRDALEDAGYQIELASGSKEALEKIGREYFDFILTDIRMPDMDGLELVKKAREKNPSLGVIFMTGYANLNTAKDAIKEGAYDYIMKPFELTEIRQAVKNAVSKKQKDTEKTLSTELTRLSDLNQLMYTVGDRNSLIRLSLGFVLMQCKSSRGSIVFRTGEVNQIGLISTTSLSANSFDESAYDFDKDYLGDASGISDGPFVVKSLAEHPLFIKERDDSLATVLVPPWFRDGDHLLNIPMVLGRKLYGLLILGFTAESELPGENDRKFLNITTSQMAISLENISLLEETTNAYKRLKDLQGQTIQLEKMATKGQMSAEIGHELNNFLGVVMGNLSLMERHLKNKNYDELEKYLKAALINLDKISKFSKDLMDFSGMTAAFESCDMNTLIGDIIDYLKSQKSFENISITFDNSTLAIFAEADQGQMQQLFYNLINNAADAIRENPDGPREIKIVTNRGADSASYSLIVSDTGGGIPPDLKDMLFQKQFTTKKTGHGFGLLVCRRIIENHHGQIKIDSTPGRGTTISLTFPISIKNRAKAAVC